MVRIAVQWALIFLVASSSFLDMSWTVSYFSGLQTDLSNIFEEGIDGREPVKDLLKDADYFLVVAYTPSGFLIILIVY